MSTSSYESVMQLSAQKIITYAKSQLVSGDKMMKDWAWIFPVIQMGKTEFSESIPTAGTDGLNVTYNPNFVKSLENMNQVFALILHENLHKVRRHMVLYQDLWKQNAKKANIALDIVINNQDLAGKNGVELPKGGVNEPKYADSSVWTLKKIYDDLDEETMNKYGGNGGLDFHDFESFNDLTPEQQAKVSKQIEIAIRQASLQKAMGIPRDIQELAVQNPDWKSLTSQFTKKHAMGKDKTTWRKPNRNYIPHNLYLPDYYSENIGGILIAGDTSGSIDKKMLSEFASHMNVLMNEVNPKFVDVAWWGTSVTGVDQFKYPYPDLFSNLKPTDGGGTDPKCIVDWMREQNPRKNYVCAIVFTDGEFFSEDVGQWDIPVLWIVVSKNAPNINVGEVVHIHPL